MSGAANASYTYNALHQRISKTVNGQTTYYLYDQAGQLLAELDGSGQTQVEYVWLETMPLAVIHSGTATAGTYYVHADHLNTPQVVSDGQGSVVWRADYGPFGQAAVAGASTLILNLRFPGQYFDHETGLHYNWHRYYDPALGRYIQSDPIGLVGGLNTYGYAYQNPMMNTDPDGRLVWFGVPAVYWAAGGMATVGAYVAGQWAANNWSDIFPKPWGPFPNPDADADIDGDAWADPNASGSSDRAERCREACSDIALPGEAAFRNCLRDCMRNPENYQCD